MGASSWDYFVAFAPDVGEALAQLRANVLSEGDFYWHGRWAPGQEAVPATEDELWADEGAQEEGTHSILDVARLIGAQEADDFGTVRPLTEAEVEAHLGGARPTRSSFEAAFNKGSGALAHIAPRWSGLCTTLFSAAGEPAEIAFWGYSGD